MMLKLYSRFTNGSPGPNPITKEITMKTTTETIKASAVALSFVQETVSAVAKAKDLIALHSNDYKAAGKDLLAACKETYDGFKSNGKKGTPGLLTYNACRKQLDLLKKMESDPKGPKDYDAKARFDAMVKEINAHDDLAALFAVKFAAKPRKAAKK